VANTFVPGGLFIGQVAFKTLQECLKINRPKVERHISKALDLGVEAALEDLPRKGKPQVITPEARAWVVSIACQKPRDRGYSYELWTTRLLAEHVRKHCLELGFDCLEKLSRGTVSKILSKNKIKPHKIQYYVERRDPEFDQKMIQVLHVYKEVQVISEKGEDSLTAYISYDEKPGIQAIENTAPDLPPSPGKHATVYRDHEYVRHGALSLLAGIDLLTGEVIATVEERHRSQEMINFLKKIDDHYPDKKRITIVLDNHSAHTSKETRTYLATVPNRFEFVFTPKHGSWLNIIESFFGKLARTVLRGIRVKSKDELAERILSCIDMINESPVVYRWKYKLDSISVI
jgi:transposase